MSQLRNIQAQAQTELFNKHKVFFAFSNKQLEEGKQQHGITDDVKLVSIGAGGYMLKANAEDFHKEFNQLQEDSVKKHLEIQSIESIIEYELANHECQISYDYSDAFNALQRYPVTLEQVEEVFKKWIRKPEVIDSM